ncbi:MAG: outer membrane protein assembly factor BamE [Gammaproteobacteria bacterium]|nr:outer membrane protein assembly factor BamE [Gammaproteobacteria bacterium]
MTRITAAIVCLLALLLASGCIRVYRIDVQQGNDLTPKQVEALEVGMNRQQVRALLGTPLVDDPFRRDRWDYFYTFKGGREEGSRATPHQPVLRRRDAGTDRGRPRGGDGTGDLCRPRRVAPG